MLGHAAHAAHAACLLDASAHAPAPATPPDRPITSHREHRMGAAVAAVLVRERHVVEAFERAGATRPDRAAPFDALRVDPESIGTRRLLRRAVLRQAEPGRYYLDLPSWQALRSTRRRLAFILLAIVAVVFALGIVGPVTGGLAR